MNENQQLQEAQQKAKELLPKFAGSILAFVMDTQPTRKEVIVAELSEDLPELNASNPYLIEAIVTASLESLCVHGRLYYNSDSDTYSDRPQKKPVIQHEEPSPVAETGQNIKSDISSETKEPVMADIVSEAGQPANIISEDMTGVSLQENETPGHISEADVNETSEELHGSANPESVQPIILDVAEPLDESEGKDHSDISEKLLMRIFVIVAVILAIAVGYIGYSTLAAIL